MIKHLLSDQSFHLLPACRCVLCGELSHSNTALLCEPCLYDLPAMGLSCSICATEISTGEICGKCQAKPPFFDHSYIPLKYTFPVNIIIKRLKYKDKILFSRILATLLYKQLENRIQDFPECIVPVPLHPLRLMQRGFNQSKLISSEISKLLACPVDDLCCQRVKHTDHQTGMNKNQREKNIRAAFSVKTPATYKHIAILDDVVTTGSTVNELARYFKQAGVDTVEVWACAKANIVDS